MYKMKETGQHFFGLVLIFCYFRPPVVKVLGVFDRMNSAQW